MRWVLARGCPEMRPLIERVLGAVESLRDKRPVFYNEADFQHALAWELQLADPAADLRLEIPLLAGGRERLDLFARFGEDRLALELKFPRAPLRAEVNGEPVAYERRSQDAEDDTRYAIAQDLRRIERILAEGVADSGAVVVLTNISALWRVPSRPTTALDAAFRIHEGVGLRGDLKWGPGGRAKVAVSLEQTYACEWHDYSSLTKATGSGLFRYTVLSASADRAEK